MSTYYVTAAAGREVAGRRNPDAGKPIELTDAQAAHPLRLGYISREEPAAPAIAAKPKAAGK